MSASSENDDDRRPEEQSILSLVDKLDSQLAVTADATGLTSKDNRILFCDAGYGLPREARPRKEKILAISRQLINFLVWQQENCPPGRRISTVKVVACPDEQTRTSLEQRTLQLLSTGELPRNLSFSCQTLEDACHVVPGEGASDMSRTVYLSPDAAKKLDPFERAPTRVVIGLLIDRRIQPNRSRDRAANLLLETRRWPLEDCFETDNISVNEPLNVDCVLEGMQQWWWNEDLLEKTDNLKAPTPTPEKYKENFAHAAQQAIHNHVNRHPARPVHKVD